MAESEQTETARKRLAEDQERTEKIRQQQAERARSKPTPTQEENDLAALGAHLVEKEPDGSPIEDPTAPDAHGRRSQKEERHQEANKPRPGYETRAVQARPQSTPGKNE